MKFCTAAPKGHAGTLSTHLQPPGLPRTAVRATRSPAQGRHPHRTHGNGAPQVGRTQPHRAFGGRRLPWVPQVWVPVRLSEPCCPRPVLEKAA